MSLPGFERVPGSAGRYLNTQTGQTISRRQYENERIRQTSPYQSLSEFNRVKKEPKYNFYAKAWAEEKGKSLREARKPTSDFARQYAAIKNQDWSRAPTDAWAELLTDIGWRDIGAFWNVGDTPKAGY